MSAKTIAIIAALDAKGAEARFIADIILGRGHRALMIDIGVLADPLSTIPHLPIARLKNYCK